MTWLENQMAELLIIAVLALPVLTLWRSIVAILVRPFGVRLPLFSFRLKRLRTEISKLSHRAYILVEGVLNFGIGVWLLLNIVELVSSRLGVAGRAPRRDLFEVLLQLGYFLAMGAGWGWLMWDGLPTHDPFRRSESLSIAPKNRE
jgi:hypothetical protein